MSPTTAADDGVRPTPPQRRLLAAQRLAPGRGHANVVRVLRMRGPLDAGRLERALADLVRRHASLRTVFPPPGEEAVVRDAAGFALAREPATGASDVAALVARVGAEEARRPFDLAVAPLLRARLVDLGPDDHLLAFTVHNIACDGWSLGLALRELAAACAGEPAPPAPPVARARGVDAARRAADLAWWRARLAGTPGALAWPARREAAIPGAFDARRHVLSPGDALPAAVAALARARATTPYAVHLAAFLVSLRALGAGDDQVIGTPVARRDAGTRASIGLHTDLVPVRVDLAGAASFDALLARARAAASDAFLHAEVGYQDLVDALPPRDAPPAWPLFDAALNVTGDRQRIPRRWGGLDVEPLAIAACDAQFALTLYVRDDAPFALELVHREDALDADAGAAFLARHAERLARAVADPGRSIDALARG